MKHSIRKIPYGKFRMAQKCYVCNGTGVDICPKCNGHKTFNGKTCPECNGRGIVKCYACGGRGIID